MLPKKYRISKEFFKKLRRAVNLYSTLHSLSLYPLPFGNHSKVSCVVSRKISTNAVVRNRIRRRVYAALHPFLLRFKIPTAVIVYPKHAVVSVTYEESRRDLERLLASIMK